MPLIEQDQTEAKAPQAVEAIVSKLEAGGYAVVVPITQADYDLLSPPDAAKMYAIIPA